MCIQVWKGVSQRLLSLTLMGPILWAGPINESAFFTLSEANACQIAVALIEPDF